VAEDSVQTGAGSNSSRANLALGLAVAALVAMAVLAAIDADGPIWLVVGVLSLAAVITGLVAGGGRPRGRALAAVVLGGVLFVVFVVFTIMEA